MCRNRLPKLKIFYKLLLLDCNGFIMLTNVLPLLANEKNPDHPACDL